MITKLINNKTKRYVRLKNLIISSRFSWTWQNQTTPKQNKNGYDNFGFYVHSFLDRPVPLRACYSNPCSKYITDANNAIAEILVHNGLTPKVIYRMSANCVHPTNSGTPSVPHVDHDFPHDNLLIYLTDPQGGETIVGDEEYLGEEDDVITWEGELHHHRPPVKGRRIVLIATFISQSNANTRTN